MVSMEEHNSLTMSKRIYWVDWAKAIGISLVVWAHISPIARHEVFLFHMPFFFMISGLLFRQKGFLQELKGSAFSIALPYFIYNLLYMSPLPFGGGKGYEDCHQCNIGKSRTTLLCDGTIVVPCCPLCEEVSMLIAKKQIGIYGNLGLYLICLFFRIFQY